MSLTGSGGKRQVQIILFQFADATLFYWKSNYQNILIIKSIFRCFELILGVKINFHKSKLGFIGVDEAYERTLNCNRMPIPFMYFGMLVGGNRRIALFWKDIIETIKSRLSK